MKTRQKRVATDTWRSLGCRTTPLEQTFSKILQLEKGANYVVPFERYIKMYKLNGHNTKK